MVRVAEEKERGGTNRERERTGNLSLCNKSSGVGRGSYGWESNTCFHLST